MIKAYLMPWLKQSSNNFHFAVIFIILIAISLVCHYLIILFIFYLIFLLKKKCLNKELWILSIIVSLYLIIAYFSSNYEQSYYNGKVIVSNVNENSIIIRKGIKKYIAYGYYKLNPGDLINVSFKTVLPDLPSYSGDFNQTLYLKSSGLTLIEIDDFEYINSYFTINYFKSLILAFYEPRMDEDYFPLFKILIFADDTSFDSTFYNKLNLAHVLAISGFHIVIIYNFLFKLLFKITKRYFLSEKITLIFLVFYTLLCGASPSVLRALIFLFVKKYFGETNVLTRLDCFCVTFLIMMIRPLMIYSLSFILGQLASFIILYLHEFVKSKNYLLTNFLRGLIFIGITFPFITNINNEMSLLALFSFLFLEFFTYLWLPLSFIFLLVPKLSFYLSFLFVSFTNLINVSGDLLIVRFPYMPPLFKVIYYLVLVFLLSSVILKKRRIISISFITVFFIIFLNINSFRSDKVEYVDVGQGDTTYIKYEDYNILIDCYNVEEFLLKQGVKNIDYIFISHEDNDHMGDLENILKSYEVKMVYGAFNSSDFINLCKERNTSYQELLGGASLNIGDMQIEVLAPYVDLKETNSNSLVLNIRLFNKSFLFTGDATKIEEEYIINNNFPITCDYLKVAHHGSDTSSQDSFLEWANPQVSIISVKKNNSYNLPSLDVLSRLKRISKVYLTKDNGNIKVTNKGLYTFKQ